MHGRKVGSVLSSGLLALALALAVLQATVLVHSTSPERVTTSASSPQAPVHNGAVPWVPAPAAPSERELARQLGQAFAPAQSARTGGDGRAAPRPSARFIHLARSPPQREQHRSSQSSLR